MRVTVTTSYVGLVEVGGGLVEGEDAAVEAKSLGEREPDDQTCEHLPHRVKRQVIRSGEWRQMLR